jgi:hypothetical protein
MKRVAKMAYEGVDLDLEESVEVNYGNVPVYSDRHGQAVPMPQSQLYLDRVNPDYLVNAISNAEQRQADNNSGVLIENLYLDEHYSFSGEFNNLRFMNIREYASCVQLKDISPDEFDKAVLLMHSGKTWTELKGEANRSGGRTVTTCTN